MDELDDSSAKSDPLAGESHEIVPGPARGYPDRALFLVTTFCSTYCRYCARSRIVGDVRPYRGGRWEKALDYIKYHHEVRDVLIFGGDPLTLSDETLDYLLSRIRAIFQVELIRIGQK